MINYSVLYKNALLRNVKDITNILSKLDTKVKQYQKDELILEENTFLSYLGIVLSGSAKICKYDEAGNENIVSILREGDLFGEVFVIAKLKVYINVVALKKISILWISYESLLKESILSDNLLSIVAYKNLELNKRVNAMSKHSIKEKVLSYLLSFKQKEVTIGMNRNELAAYLGVDRSALSRELALLKRQKIINYNKNHFTIINF